MLPFQYFYVAVLALPEKKINSHVIYTVQTDMSLKHLIDV